MHFIRHLTRLGLFLIGISALNANAKPEGYRIQELEPLGGEVIMPTDWHYESSIQENDFLYVFSKEELTEKGYQTGFRIQGFIKVSEQGALPSEVTQSNIERFKGKAKRIIKICDEEEQGPFQKRCLESIEPNQLNPQDDFHVIYSFFWNDDADMVVVSIFGAPESSWPEAEKIYEQMKDFTLINHAKIKRGPARSAGD